MNGRQALVRAHQHSSGAAGEENQAIGKSVGSGGGDDMLVYYETDANYVEAARCEKRFKNWCRQWKLNLI